MSQRTPQGLWGCWKLSTLRSLGVGKRLAPAASDRCTKYDTCSGKHGWLSSALPVFTPMRSEYTFDSVLKGFITVHCGFQEEYVKCVGGCVFVCFSISVVIWRTTFLCYESCNSIFGVVCIIYLRSKVSNRIWKLFFTVWLKTLRKFTALILMTFKLQTIHVVIFCPSPQRVVPRSL